MRTAKLIFYALILFLAATGAVMLFGVLISAAQYLFWLGAILLVGFIAVKLLKKKPEKPQLEIGQADKELQAAIRRIEEIKRAQLPGK